MSKSFSQRLLQSVALVLLLAAVGTLVGYSFQSIHQRLLSSRFEFVEDKVKEARQIIDSYYQLSLYGRMSVHEAQAAALRTLSDMRFGDNGYYWVVDNTATFIMQPASPQLLGHVFEAVDYRDDALLSDRIPRLLQHEGGGVLYYRWPKPGEAQPVEKISVVEAFKPWGWGVGTGVYIDDINLLFWEEVNNLLIVAGVLLLILFLFWYGFQYAIFKDGMLANYRKKKPF